MYEGVTQGRSEHGSEGIRKQNGEKDRAREGVQREGMEQSCMYEEQQRTCPMYLVALRHCISEESGGKDDVSLFWSCMKKPGMSV